MNIKGLRIFVFIMQEGTLAKAANKVNLSQPAASRLLGLLEDSLGGALFYRQKNRLIPTPEGEKFFPEAMRVLSILDSIPGAFKDIKQGKTRPLRIACHPRLLHSLVIPAVAELTRIHPDIRTRLDSVSRKELLRSMERNVYDIGIGALPIPDNQLQTVSICNAKLYVLLPLSNPLAEQPSLSIADLQNIPFISLTEHSLINQLIEQTLTEAKTPEPQHIVSTIASACRLLQEGIDGFTIGDPLSYDLEYLNIVKFVPFEPATEIEFGAFLNDSENPHPALNDFIHCLKQVGSSAVNKLNNIPPSST